MGVLWYRYLYIGEMANKQKKKIKWKIRHRAGTLRVYLLTMPSNDKNSLDIINAAYLKQPYYKKREIRIVGIALTYEEALQVLLQIVDDVYKNTKGMDIKGYLNKERWQV